MLGEGQQSSNKNTEKCREMYRREKQTYVSGSGYGFCIHIPDNQKRCGCVPQTIQCDFRQFILMGFVVDADNILGV